MESKAINAICKVIRTDILSMINAAGSGHPGGSLSAVELLSVLYFTDIFSCDPDYSDNVHRDRFILSKGHCAPVLYSVLCRRGFLKDELLSTLRKMGSPLQGHPHRAFLPGLDTSSGSLGQGLSIANGMAYAMRRKNLTNRVYCLIGDGELQEGQIWEAALTAAQLKLSNICAIVDNNHVQLDGRTEDIKIMEPVAEKWRAFGWNVLEIDGHDVEAVYNAYLSAKEQIDKPTVIIAETVKGKGVSFMEHDPAWHGQAPDSEQLITAISGIKGVAV